MHITINPIVLKLLGGYAAVTIPLLYVTWRMCVSAAHGDRLLGYKD
jgi:hypothetical protein